MPEHETVGQWSPSREVGDFLHRCREQIAQRWADATLFRTVFTVSRDEAVEACKAVIDALSVVAATERIEEIEAPGFAAVHPGIDLGSVVTRATLADALALALRRQGAGAVVGAPTEVDLS
ncbi:RsbRD N-terminal domain-containing protein [Streptantibioticus rubrisoli]|uniref:RsbRD N-terminal domain-containing protein n=1 Tax=Streptantibioticus rubrisoli TaxID=1387313 RepID=UPI00355867D9